MSNLFAGVYGAKFPEVVMNSGPLPPEGGLPAPLHDTPDARINYGSTLLGDLQPYAYGEAGYMSSQSQNNQPHRIQKIIPELYLPEPSGQDVFKLSHAVDDSDLAFVMRLNRNSIFCTGSRTSTRRNTKMGTTVDPIINLATLNYLLAGLQIGRPDLPGDGSSLWWEFLNNLDPEYWPKDSSKRVYTSDMVTHELPDSVILPVLKDAFLTSFQNQPFGIDDIIHIIRHCVKPFGVVRGSERQGGQHEMSSGAATWTTSAIATLVIDGKEANVVNIWHHQDIHAGDDLVLRLKVMPVKTYTLNHYFKGFARKSFEVPSGSNVWQLVPDIFSLTSEKENSFVGVTNTRSRQNMVDDFKATFRNLHSKNSSPEEKQRRSRHIDAYFLLSAQLMSLHEKRGKIDIAKYLPLLENTVYNDPHYTFPWQQLGFWHIGRSQVMRKQYGESHFYNDDLANGLKTNHIDMTFQPTFSCLPVIPMFLGLATLPKMIPFSLVGKTASVPEEKWTPDLQLEQIPADNSHDFDFDTEPPLKRAHAVGDEMHYFDTRTFAQPEPAPSPVCFKAEAFSPCESSAPRQIGLVEPAPEEPVATLDAMTVDLGAPSQDAGISEGSRAELLAGLSAPKKTGRGAGKGRKWAEPTPTSRGPVDGTLLRPGAEPEACRMELL